MPILTSSQPTPVELLALSKFFLSIQKKINAYTASPQGQSDPSLTDITGLSLDLGSEAADIATMALDLQVTSGPDPVKIINDTTDALNKAIAVRNDITQALGWIQSIVTFATAIASGN